MVRHYEDGATCTTQPSLAVLSLTCTDILAGRNLGTYPA